MWDSWGQKRGGWEGSSHFGGWFVRVFIWVEGVVGSDTAGVSAEANPGLCRVFVKPCDFVAYFYMKVLPGFCKGKGSVRALLYNDKSSAVDKAS